MFDFKSFFKLDFELLDLWVKQSLFKPLKLDPIVTFLLFLFFALLAQIELRIVFQHSQILLALKLRQVYRTGDGAARTRFTGVWILLNC